MLDQGVLGIGMGYSNGLGDLLNQQMMALQQANYLNQYPSGLQNTVQVNPDDRLLVLLTEVE